MTRARIRFTLSAFVGRWYSLVQKLGDDIEEACEILAKKGGVHPAERKKVHTGTSY